MGILPDWLTGGVDDSSYQGIKDKNPVDDVDQGAYVDNTALTNRQNDLKATQGRWDQTQQSLAQSYQDAISGKAPSVAQTQLGLGQDAAMRQLQSAGAAHRGLNAGLANRSLLSAQSNLLGQQNGQAALLRAQEVNQARSGLGQTAAIGRQQALGQSQFSYGMDRDAMVMAQQYEQAKRAQQQGLRDRDYSRVSGNNQGDARVVNAATGAAATGLAKLAVP
jgi:hypothetical protein